MKKHIARILICVMLLQVGIVGLIPSHNQVMALSVTGGENSFTIMDTNPNSTLTLYVFDNKMKKKVEVPIAIRDDSNRTLTVKGLPAGKYWTEISTPNSPIIEKKTVYVTSTINDITLQSDRMTLNHLGLVNNVDPSLYQSTSFKVIQNNTQAVVGEQTYLSSDVVTFPADIGLNTLEKGTYYIQQDVKLNDGKVFSEKSKLINLIDDITQLTPDIRLLNNVTLQLNNCVADSKVEITHTLGSQVAVRSFDLTSAESVQKIYTQLHLGFGTLTIRFGQEKDGEMQWSKASNAVTLREGLSVSRQNESYIVTLADPEVTDMDVCFRTILTPYSTTGYTNTSYPGQFIFNGYNRSTGYTAIEDYESELNKLQNKSGYPEGIILDSDLVTILPKNESTQITTHPDYPEIDFNPATSSTKASIEFYANGMNPEVNLYKVVKNSSPILIETFNASSYPDAVVNNSAHFVFFGKANSDVELNETYFATATTDVYISETDKVRMTSQPEYFNTGLKVKGGEEEASIESVLWFDYSNEEKEIPKIEFINLAEIITDNSGVPVVLDANGDATISTMPGLYCFTEVKARKIYIQKSEFNFIDAVEKTEMKKAVKAIRQISNIVQVVPRPVTAVGGQNTITVTGATSGAAIIIVDTQQEMIANASGTAIFTNVPVGSHTIKQVVSRKYSLETLMIIEARMKGMENVKKVESPLPEMPGDLLEPQSVFEVNLVEGPPAIETTPSAIQIPTFAAIEIASKSAIDDVAPVEKEKAEMPMVTYKFESRPVSVNVTGPAPIVPSVPSVPTVTDNTPVIINTPKPLPEVVIVDEDTPEGLITFTEPYITGFPNQMFKPTQFVTRGEVATVFARILKLDTLKVVPKAFSDVDASVWSAPYIYAAANQGLLKGYLDGSFKPNQAITRAELAAVIAEYWKVVKYQANPKSAPLTDISGHWAAEAISKLYNKGLLLGFGDKTFRPNNQLRREQLVVIINNLINRPVFINLNPTFQDTSVEDWYFGYVEAASAPYKKQTTK